MSDCANWDLKNSSLSRCKISVALNRVDFHIDLLTKVKHPIRRFRYMIYLADILLLSCTAFGGPQVHLMMMIERLVRKRGYISEEELLELQALCQVLPGPSSTQTVTAISLKIGGRL
jgi:hypothetical protein